MGQSTVIRFTCPQGHKMSAPAVKAGSMGKCPQCQTMFEVPKPPKDYNGLDVLRAEEIIEFYCPNEHYLRAPAKLQGKRGQCPHCGEKFVVPSLEEEAAAPTAAVAESGEMVGLGQIQEIGQQPPQEEVEKIEEVEEVEEVEVVEPHVGPKPGGSSGGLAPNFSFIEAQAESDEYAAPPPEPPAPHGHPLAALFERIWEESDREAVVELELKTGERIAPLNYAHDVSRGQFGIFAIRAHDGTHTVTVIAWDDVVRITVKQLKELPPTMFN
jgi:hypothetical protein